MEKLFCILTAAGLVAIATQSASATQDPAPLPADSIIDRYVRALGGLEAIRRIETIEYSQGRYREGDFIGSGNARMAFRRPYYRVVGNPDDLSGFMEGFDGGTWEWYPDPGIVVRTVGPAAGATRRGADFEGWLVDYRAKGSTVEVLGIEEIDGRPAHRIALTNRDGFRRDYFVDAETWLVVAERQAAPIHAFGAVVASESRVGDYRPVDGVLIAHRFRETEIGSGRLLSEMQWGAIRSGVDLPESHFSPPDVPRGPLRKMLEGLYAARTDADAALWIYDAFRLSYPDIDERAGVELIAYQMLKMQDATPTAIRILERNAAAHPDAPSAAFSLGRAFETAGYPSTAAEQYRRALRLDPEHRASRSALDRMGPP